MLAISNPDDLLREDRIFYTVMLVECLLLLAIIMMTKAFHCYLHYRAARAGVVLPAEGPALNEGNVQDLHNQVVNEIVHSDAETMPSQTPPDKKRKRSPRRRRTSKTAQAAT